MGLRDAIIIVLLSQSLCKASGRGLAGSLLQGLLSSNPQLLKMAANRLAPCRPCYEVQPVIQTQLQNGPVIQTQSQKVQYSPAVVQSQNCQYQIQNVVKDVPVVTKETQTIQQTQYPTIQQTEASFPLCNPTPPICSPATMVNPFLPAASPISALCPPTSSLLPPVNPGLVRSQYLRKIPIPPPCL